MKLFPERPHLPRLAPYRPLPGDPRLFSFNEERASIVRQVVDRVVARLSADPAALERTLLDLAYHEVQRLERQHDEEASRVLPEVREIGRRILRSSHAEQVSLAQRHAERMAHDVAGNFDPRVYAFAARAVPELLSSILEPGSLARRFIDGERTPLATLLSAEGAIERTRRLADRGVLVFVPTHSSNLDSIAVGQTLLSEDLPPAVYGAGKNLFSNPLISFFMHNLGAYRVDRRVRAALYKDVLKTYASVMVERGYHSLFFPGGTRSRSGRIEERLKLGLAGSAVEAFARSHAEGTPRRVFFVPMTINYMLVLEAETLIDDCLAEAGKARYIIEDDEFSRIDRWLAFLRKSTSVGGGCVIRFGDPMDPFGNFVDDQGNSMVPGPRTVDPTTYVTRGGRVVVDAERDAAFTRELGDRLAEQYERHTVLMTTQVAAHVLYRAFVRATLSVDPFVRLRQRGEFEVEARAVVAELGALRDRLVTLEQAGLVRLYDRVRQGKPDSLMDDALRAFGGYHQRIAAERRGDRLVVHDPRLLLFYQNRLAPFAEALADEANRAAARAAATFGARR